MRFQPQIVLGVQNQTARLRSDDDPIGVRLRELLRARGVAPETAQAGWLYDDVGGWYGMVCTPTRQVFEFGLDVAPGPVEGWEMTVWKDLTGAPPATDQVACALAIASDALLPAEDAP